jgi:hypothetical protein
MIYELLNFFPRENTKKLFFPDTLDEIFVINFTRNFLPIVFKTLKFKNFSVFLFLQNNESSLSIFESLLIYYFLPLTRFATRDFRFQTLRRRKLKRHWKGFSPLSSRKRENENSMFFFLFHFTSKISSLVPEKRRRA